MITKEQLDKWKREAEKIIPKNSFHAVWSQDLKILALIDDYEKQAEIIAEAKEALENLCRAYYNEVKDVMDHDLNKAEEALAKIEKLEGEK